MRNATIIVSQWNTMAFDPHAYIVRQPRHTAADASSSRIWIEELEQENPQQRDVVLLDFSRKGAKLELTSPITPGGQVLLHVQDDAANLNVRLKGTVRWQRRQAEGCWLLGCQFEQLVEYEVIGELFISGILATESDGQ